MKIREPILDNLWLDGE